MTGPLLQVRGLDIRFPHDDAHAVAGVDLEVASGEIIGLVGESGSGKSASCRALLGLLPATARIAGRMQFDGADYDLAAPRGLSGLRGTGIGLIGQDPMSALDPLMTVHRHLALRDVRDPQALLHEAGLDDPDFFLGRYAHELSGGQAQRVAIACALARSPKLLIADEPTTALDVTVQARILDHLKDVSARRGMAVILVTHDLAVVHATCARVVVLQKGAVVETGPVARVLGAPQKDYTRRLINAIPRPGLRGMRLGLPHGVREPFPRPAIGRGSGPVLSFDGVSVGYPQGRGGPVRAVCDVSLDLFPGEIVGLVGESGSGKSSLAKTAVGLVRPTAGRVRLGDTALDWRAPDPAWRRQIQYIFQDPLGALDPGARVLAQTRAPLDIHRIGDPAGRNAVAQTHLGATGLDPALHRRKPGALSGGQRQRVTIARALTLSPKVLICDESVSALDVSIQARVLNLLMDLRARHGLSILFISHDLAVIRHIADRVAVMQHGALVETGPSDDLFAAPRADYTRALLAAVPALPQEAA